MDNKFRFTTVAVGTQLLQVFSGIAAYDKGLTLRWSQSFSSDGQRFSDYIKPFVSNNWLSNAQAGCSKFPY